MRLRANYLLLPLCVATLLLLTNTTFAQTKFYKFSKTFISSHYTAGNPIGILAANSFSPASMRDLWRC